MSDETIKKLLYDAQLVIDGLKDSQGANSEEVRSIRHGVLRWAGFKGDAVSDKTWTLYIPMMPDSIREVMVNFDDALNFQDSTGLMYNL